MGTRSIVRVIDNDKTILAIYSQFDGYVSGMGRDLAKALSGRKMVNGIPGNADRTALFNGPGCMAAQIVRQLKDDEAGGIYITNPDAEDEEYNYNVSVGRAVEGWKVEYLAPTVEVTRYGKMIFTGTLEAFQEFVQKEEE